MRSRRRVTILAAIPFALLQLACPLSPPSSPPADEPAEPLLEPAPSNDEAPPDIPETSDEPEASSGPITGYYAGMLIGPEARTDGVNFDAAWVVAVRFDDAGVLTDVSEIFDLGETWSIGAIGQPIHREESGDDFRTKRDLTVVRAQQSAGVAEIELAYSRANRVTVSDDPAYASYVTAIGGATLRLTRDGVNLHCDVQRSWNPELPDVDSTWSASGTLVRDGNPQLSLSGVVVRDLPGDHGGQLPSCARLEFNSAGRLVMVRTLRGCVEELDQNYHFWNVITGDSTHPQDNHFSSRIVDLRYFPDGILVRLEVVNDVTYPDFGLHVHVAEMRVQPQADAIRGYYAYTRYGRLWGWESDHGETEWIELPQTPQIAATWRGTLSGQRLTSVDGEPPVADNYSETFAFTFDEYGQLVDPLSGVMNGDSTCDDVGCGWTYVTGLEYGDGWTELQLHYEFHAAHEPSGSSNDTSVRLDRNPVGPIESLDCTINRTFESHTSDGHHSSGAWTASGPLTRQ